MFSGDRDEFDKQVSVLFGGWPGTFLTDERKEAYWRGMQKMQMSMFIRCVDFVLSEEGPAKIPTVAEVWEISKKFKQQNAAPPRGAHTDLRDYWRRLDGLVQMRKLMPKDRNGHIVAWEYVPESRRAAHKFLWDKYLEDTPGNYDAYCREQELLFTGACRA